MKINEKSDGQMEVDEEDKEESERCGTDAAFISVAGKWLWPQAELVTSRRQSTEHSVVLSSIL